MRSRVAVAKFDIQAEANPTPRQNVFWVWDHGKKHCCWLYSVTD